MQSARLIDVETKEDGLANIAHEEARRLAFSCTLDEKREEEMGKNSKVFEDDVDAAELDDIADGLKTYAGDRHVTTSDQLPDASDQPPPQLSLPRQPLQPLPVARATPDGNSGRADHPQSASGPSAWSDRKDSNVHLGLLGGPENVAEDAVAQDIAAYLPNCPSGPDCGRGAYKQYTARRGK